MHYAKELFFNSKLYNFFHVIDLSIVVFEQDRSPATDDIGTKQFRVLNTKSQRLNYA
jgi:hypothetical protein